MANGEENKEPVKGFKSHIPLIAGILVALIGLWYWHKEYSKYINTDDAFVDSDKVGVSPKMVGRIAKIYFQESDTVKKGMLMAELDSTELKARQQQIATMMEQDLVSINKSEAEYELSKENIELQVINLERIKEDYTRAKNQFEGGVITLETYEHIQKDYEAAKAKLTETEKQVIFVKSQIQVAQTQLEKSKTLYAFINTLLNNSRLYAPINGFVAKRWLLPGDVVVPGQSIYSLVRDSLYWVSVFLEETKLSSAKIGNKAIITLDAFPNHPLTGKIYYISSNIAAQFSLNPPNNAAGNFTKISQRYNLKISIDQATSGMDMVKPFKIFPGMSAVVKIIK